MKPINRIPRVALCLLLAAGCSKKPPVTPQSIDADANSGADGKRTGAVPIPVNQNVTDEVNFDKQDQTDWKSVELKGRPGVLGVELHWENPLSDLNVDVFDAFGTQIGSSPGPSQGTQAKKLSVPIESPGTYYLRVQAPKARDGSIYTVEAKWEGTEAPPEKEKPRPHGHGKPKEKKWHGEGGVQGRIVSSYREGASLILHLDKGAAAQLKVGQSGTILEGPSGETPLEGGSFVITQVIDDTRSIARTSLRSIGRNTRVAINTGR